MGQPETGQLARAKKQVRRGVRSLRRRRRVLVERARTSALDARDLTAVWRARARLATWRRGGEFAVALHLFYPEVWPALRQRLERLDALGVDLVVTLPPQHRAFARQVRAGFPAARCVVVPNRGRDVLPFTLVATRLAALGYTAVLKLHSKKSEHFTGGQRWRDGMLDELAPADRDALQSILTALRDPATGLVGPRSVYFPLSTYWAGNAAAITRLVASATTAEGLARLGEPRLLGFFAGTMFWTRLDAVRPLLASGPLEFAREPTPKDGTLAHALERALCVLPELNGRTQYDSDGRQVARRDALAEDVPEWYREATRVAVAEEQARARAAKAAKKARAARTAQRPAP